MAGRAGTGAAASTYSQNCQLHEPWTWIFQCATRHTLHLKVIGLRNIQQVITLGNLQFHLGTVLVDESNVDSVTEISQSCLLIDRDSEGLTPRRAWAA